MLISAAATRQAVPPGNPSGAPDRLIIGASGAVSALIGTSLYTVQRTSHVRLFAPRLAWFVFYAWQGACVLGALSLFAGLKLLGSHAPLG